MEKNGRVITFYSFKGGVGRTMALANCAYLLARNGYRVLAMDWDLEAPGLVYYFRGLLDGESFRRAKESDGILNLLWDWGKAVKEASGADDIERLLELYESGSRFWDATFEIPLPSSSAEDDDTGSSGELFCMGAGRDQMADGTTFEDALSRFSWTKFFSEFGGGSAVGSIKKWAERNFDFVLIDSRTGLADVAGICTMQLPDTVLLCFVLNRQNMDGVSRIAAAIRQNRQEQVALHAVPMRTSREGTSEESDARARAAQSLIRVGGFSAEAANEDLKVLNVAAAANVPYYETMSQVVATDPIIDQLTLNYIRLLRRVTGLNLSVPEVNPHWAEQVKARLQPRQATAEYIRKLRSSDPSRAAAEMARLVEGALESLADDASPDAGYIEELIDVVLSMNELSTEGYSGFELIEDTLRLIRALSTGDPEQWREKHISTLERCLTDFGFFIDVDEELVLLDELDSLLSYSDLLSDKVKKMGFSRRAAKNHLLIGNPEAAQVVAGELIRSVKDMSHITAAMPRDLVEEIQICEFDAMIILGDASKKDDIDKSYGYYREVERRVGFHADEGRENLAISRENIIRIAFDAASRLAQIGPETQSWEKASEYAIASARGFHWGVSITNITSIFSEISRPLINLRDPKLTLKFCEALFQAPDARVQQTFSLYFARSPRLTLTFCTTITELIDQLEVLDQSQTQSIFNNLFVVLLSLRDQMSKRRRTINEKSRSELDQILANLMDRISVRIGKSPPPSRPPASRREGGS